MHNNSAQKHIISFVLWGNNDCYNAGAIKNCELASTLYSGWICRFFIGSNTCTKTVQLLKAFHNVEIIDMKSKATPKSMVWRFLPCSDLNVDIMISRDVDCRLSLREKDAVNEWLASGKAFHIMRDHPFHSMPMMGGMWGAKCNAIREMQHLIDWFEKNNIYDDKKNYDQVFLTKMLYPRIMNNVFVHDDIFENAHQFKIPRDKSGVYFIGEIFTPHDKHDSFCIRWVLDYLSLIYKLFLGKLIFKAKLQRYQNLKGKLNEP